MTIALVYQDYVHNNGALLQRLRDTPGVDATVLVDARDIIQGKVLEQHGNAILIMPGGADLYYCEKLNGAGNQAIRDFVARGGMYLGICAGAYYGCHSLKWAEAEGDHAICGPRELAFFPGAAVGPVYDLIEDHDFQKSWAGLSDIVMEDGVYPAYYEGGPVFESAETGFTVHGQMGKCAMIVEVAHGKGRAILSGPHIEYTPALLRASLYQHNNKNHARVQAIADEFETLWTPDRDIWTVLITPHFQH